MILCCRPPAFVGFPSRMGRNVWAKAAMGLLHQPAPSRASAIAALRESPMDMDRALEGLLKIHE